MKIDGQATFQKYACEKLLAPRSDIWTKRFYAQQLCWRGWDVRRQLSDMVG